MLESQFGGEKPDFEIEEGDNRRSLEAEYLSDVPEHEKVSLPAREKLIQKVDRLKALASGEAKPEIKNEKNIIRSSIQNIAVREILTQKNGPVSVGREDFKEVLERTHPEWAEDLFNKETWGGIQTAARSIELDLRNYKDNITAREVIFIDELDANDATDYVFTGIEKSDDQTPDTHVAKLVQVGNSLNYKKPEAVRQQHKALAEKLRNKASYPLSYEEMSEDAELTVADIIRELGERELDYDQLAQEGISILAKYSFYPDTRERIRDLSDVQKIREELSDREYETFKEKMYMFGLLAEAPDQLHERLSELINSIASAPEEYGLEWIYEENDPEAVHERAIEVVKGLVSLVQDRELRKSIPYKIISKIAVRWDTRNELSAEEREVELDIDNEVIAMYDIDQNVLLEVVQEVINRNLT